MTEELAGGRPFDAVHLQWFSDPDDKGEQKPKADDGGEDDDADKELNDRIKRAVERVARELEHSKKESSGKDKKIGELQSQIRELQQATYSKEQLADLKLREAEEKIAAAEKIEREADGRIRSAEVKNMRFEVLSGIQGWPMSMSELVTGDSKEDVEISAKKIMKLIVSERDKRENVRKVSSPPKSGDGKQISMTRDRWADMTTKERTEWSATASNEEIDAVNSGLLDDK